MNIRSCGCLFFREALINSRCVERRDNFSSDVLKIRRHTDVCQGFLVQNDGKFASDAYIAELFRGSLDMMQSSQEVGC